MCVKESVCEGERERVCVCVRVGEKERVCEGVCVCERENVCERERKKERAREGPQQPHPFYVFRQGEQEGKGHGDIIMLLQVRMAM